MNGGMDIYSRKLRKEIKAIMRSLKIKGGVYNFRYSMSFRQWTHVCELYKLSEEFIEKFQNLVYWNAISISQNLSEEFIERFSDRVNWERVSAYQELSEKFIEKMENFVYWPYIFKYQKLSESFVKKFLHKPGSPYAYKYQKITSTFDRSNNWMYATVETKEEYIRKNTLYKIHEDKQGKYILAYKGIRRDNYSAFNFQYKYEIGQEYEAHCDCNLDVENSFGLSAWTLSGAKSYCHEKILLVKIYLEDIGAIVHNGSKIRCFKFEVIKEVGKFKRLLERFT